MDLKDKALAMHKEWNGKLETFQVENTRKIR